MKKKKSLRIITKHYGDSKNEPCAEMWIRCKYGIPINIRQFEEHLTHCEQCKKHFK